MNLIGLANLRCPVCAGELEAEIASSRTTDLEIHAGATRAADQNVNQDLCTHVEEGLLICKHCKVWYPIINFVPVMLVFKTRLHDHFAKKMTERLSRRAGYTPPRWSPKPGEQSIQRTFTEEWRAVKDNELTFTYTIDGLAKLQAEVWFNSSRELTNVRRILDIGCGGYAAEAEALRLNFPGAEVFAVDLNLHLLQNGHKFIDKPWMHVVIASLFYLPLSKESFDLVFSQGVLHHTYSTREALRNVASYNRRMGGFLCVWLYAIEDHQVEKGFKGVRERLRYYLLMVGLRPLLSSSPKFVRVAAVYVIATYGYLRYRFSKTPRKAGWTFKNAVHGTYDYVTPRFAHVQGFNEVIEWYEELGYDFRLHSPAKYRRLFGRPIHGIGILGQRRASHWSS